VTGVAFDSGRVGFRQRRGRLRFGYAAETLVKLSLDGRATALKFWHM